MGKSKLKTLAAGLGATTPTPLPTPPARTEVPAQAVARFVGADGRISGDTGGRRSEPDRQRVGRGMVRLRGSGRVVRRVLIHLPPDVGESLDVYAARSRQELSAVVADALRQYIPDA